MLHLRVLLNTELDSVLKLNASLGVGFACDCPAFSTDSPASCLSPRQTWCVICYPNQEVQSQGSKNEGKGEARQGSRESKYKLLLRVGPTFKRKRADCLVMRLTYLQTDRTKPWLLRTIWDEEGRGTCLPISSCLISLMGQSSPYGV